jgi:hypothetical protein
MKSTHEQGLAIIKLCEAWRKENLTEPVESIHEADLNREALPELADAIGQILGWWQAPGVE